MLRGKIFTWVTVLFVVLLLAGSFGAGFGVGSWTRTDSPSSSFAPATADQQIARLRAEVDDVAEDAKRIDRLVTLLLAVTSIYAVALGLNSYFGLKQILDSAREDSKRVLDNARDDSNRVLERMRESFPDLANVQMNLQVIVSELNALFPVDELWTEQIFERLPWRNRQEIIMAELRLVGLEAFQLKAIAAYHPRLLRIFQGLGRFYSSKYAKENSRLDWDRACIYFERALDLGAREAGLLRDHARHLVQLEVSKLDDFDSLPAEEKRQCENLRQQAERLFLESLSKNSDDPGALDGLGWVYSQSGKQQEAIKQYSKLANNKKWRQGERARYLSASYRNIACCRYLDGEDAEVVFADLERSRRAAKELGQFETWKQEIPLDSDLKSLFAAHPDRTNALLS